MNKFMRILVFFDLPVKTKQQRKIATQFRSFLLNDGYFMLQYSCYARICLGQDALDKHTKRLEAHKPPNGSVRALFITEKQYEKMLVLIGKRVLEEENEGYEQISIF